MLFYSVLQWLRYCAVAVALTDACGLRQKKKLWKDHRENVLKHVAELVGDRFGWLTSASAVAVSSTDNDIGLSGALRSMGEP